MSSNATSSKVNKINPRRSGRSITKSVKAQEIATGIVMPAAIAEAPKAKRARAKKATTHASKASKAKATASATFPNLPAIAGATAAASDDDNEPAGEASSTAAAALTKQKPSVTAKRANGTGKEKAPAANISKKRKQASDGDETEAGKSEGEAPITKKAKADGKKADVKGKGKNKAPAAKASKKRKAADEEDVSEAARSASEAPPVKRVKTTTADERKARKVPRAPKATRVIPAKPKVVINYAPTDRLNVYVFGEGSSGELGLGTAKSAIDVKRPRLNPHLSAESVGVVHVACGGMHVAALTHDGQVLTWGVNDQGALGRDTKWEGGLRDVGDSDDESDSGSDSGLNPFESTPTAISTFPKGTVIVKLSAGDSHTLALTDEGLVYGWGTFRSNEGILGFNKDTFVQSTPVLLPNLKKIVDINSGANHCLARDQKGVVYTWGSGQQNQLGFRQMERKRYDSLIPSLLRLRGKNIRLIACGADHSFAIDGNEQVWAWGANSFGATGIYDNAGEDNAVIITPTIVNNLRLHNDTITYLAGGTHHTLASTENGQCLVWGRCDGSQTGMDPSTLPDDHVVRDSKHNARILLKPTPVPGVQDCAIVATGPDHCLAVTRNGKGYSWGFSANYQTGQGTDNDVSVATLFTNTATRDKRLNWADAGGQYSILTAVANVDSIADNGVGA